MAIIEKIKGLDEKKRQTVVFVILFFLAVPLLFLVARNFDLRMARLNQNGGVNQLKLPEMPPEVANDLSELQQEKENFDEQQRLLEEWGDFSASTTIASTMSTSTDEINNGEINFEDIPLNIPKDF